MPALLRLRFIAKHPLEKLYHSQLHGLFFNLLPPKLAQELHSKNKKPFSLWLESLQEREITLIVSILKDDLLPSLAYCYYLPDKDILIGDIPLQPKKPQGLTQIKSQTYEELLNNKPYRKVSYTFLTPCTFNRYQRDYPLPDPQLFFESLLKRWNTFSEKTLPEREIKERIFKEVSIAQLQISTQTAEISKGLKITGFVGNVSFIFHNEEISSALSPLVRFSVYSGIGRKTTMGLGRVVPGIRNLPESS